MTNEQLQRGNDIKEQISKLQSLKNRIVKDYNIYKEDESNEHLVETLTRCTQAVYVLIEINQEKFKSL